MKRVVMLAACLLCGCLDQAILRAQELEDYISKYTSENGAGYLQPFADALGANLNSGIFQSAQVSTLGFHLYIGAVTMTALVSEDQKTFTAKTEDTFSPPQTAKAPTIFGSGEGAAVTGTGGTVFNFPGGLELARVFITVPQVRIGSVLGTDATFRFVNVATDDNIGKVKLFGYGVRHSLSQYLKDFPIDLTAGFFIQQFDVGNIIEADSKYYGLQGSFTTGVLAIYGGIGAESADLKVTYDFESEPSEEIVSFDLKSVNSVRFLAGVEWKLAMLRLFADYNFASQSVIVAGLGVGF